MPLHRPLALLAALAAAAALAVGGGATAAAPASAASCTKYVATTGSDTNAGTSTAAPWKTIQKSATAAVPGDVVCVRGGTYTEKVVVKVSGTAAAPIVFQSYPSETAIVDGTGLSLSDRTGGFSLTNRAYVTVQGFEIRNFTTTSANAFPAGVWVQGSGDHLQILDNRIHGIVGECSGDCGAHGIGIYGTSSTANTATLVSGNEVYGNRLGWSESIAVNGNVTGFTVSGNYVHDNDNIGIDAIGYEGECSGCGENDRARNGLITGNTVANIDSKNNTPYGGEQSADGIYVDGGTQIVIERNRVTAANIGIEIASEHKGKSTSYVTVRTNFVAKSQQVGIAFGGYAANKGSAQNNAIVNNTLFGNSTASDSYGGEFYIQFNTASNTVENNVVYATSARRFLTMPGTSTSALTMDRNLWFAPGGGTLGTWIWKNTTYSTFAAYRAASGNDASSLIGTDPLLVSTTTPDLHLQSGSPAKNAGVALASTGTTDIDGQPRTQGSAIDLGADEVG